MKTKYLLPLLLLLLFNVIGGAAQNAKTNKPKRTVMLGQIVKDSFTGVRLKAHVTLMRQDSTVVEEPSGTLKALALYMMVSPR